MTFCDKNHAIIAHDCPSCPCCNLIKEMCEIQDEVVKLQNAIEDLKQDLEMYADNQRNSKRGF